MLKPWSGSAALRSGVRYPSGYELVREGSGEEGFLRCEPEFRARGNRAVNGQHCLVIRMIIGIGLTSQQELAIWQPAWPTVTVMLAEMTGVIGDQDASRHTVQRDDFSHGD